MLVLLELCVSMQCTSPSYAVYYAFCARQALYYPSQPAPELPDRRRCIPVAKATLLGSLACTTQSPCALRPEAEGSVALCTTCISHDGMVVFAGPDVISDFRGADHSVDVDYEGIEHL